MEITRISNDTETDLMEGLDAANDAFGEFTIIKANQAPELNAIAIIATDKAQGYLFFGFLPYGSSLWI